MKSFVSLVFCLVISVSLFAQLEKKYHPTDPNLAEWINMMYSDNADIGEVIQAYEAYYKEHTFKKNGHTQYYKRWLRTIKRDISGQYSGASWSDAQRVNQDYLDRIEASKAYRDANSEWECIGPFDFDKGSVDRSYAAGAAHIYTVEQSISNSDILYAGTATAGLWKSVDKGQNWTLLTQDMLISNVIALEIDHTNENIVYFEGGGILYKTTDGGTTWNTIGDIAFQLPGHEITDIVLHPNDNQILFLCTADGLYRSDNAGDSFTKIEDGEFQELEYHPTNNNIIYTVKLVNDQSTQFYKSTDGGNNFAAIGTGWPNPTGTDEQKRTELAVSADAPNKIFALCTGAANGGSGLYGIYVSDDEGATWNRNCCGPQVAGVPNATTNQNLMGWDDLGGDDGGQYYYDLAFDISPTNADHIFVGGVNLWISEDGGNTFTCPSKWSHSDKPNYVHADIHDIRFFGDDLWVANDGGIFYSNDDGENFNRKMLGIAGTDFWGFGTGFWDGDVMVGGTYHNGTLLKDNNVYENGWVSTGGGDNTFGQVNYADERKVYYDYGERHLSGDRMVNNSNLAFNADLWDASFAFDPRSANRIFVAQDDQLWLTNDDGLSFDMLYTFETNIDDIEVSWFNPDMILISTYPGWWETKKIYRSTDGGSSWDDITPSSAVLGGDEWVRYNIATSDASENTIWISRNFPYSGNDLDGKQILKSTNGGDTWTSISTPSLNGETITNIVHHRGSDGGIYAGTKRAVYYKNNSMADWELFNNNLPISTYSTELIPYYKEGKIRNGSNRSVYEVELYETAPPAAQISMDRFSSFCSRDTFYFSDHSALNENGATWAWSFPGGNPETSTERQAKITYSQAGTYSVSLTVTDINGSSSQTLSNIINISNECDVDTIPGFSLELNNSGDFASISNMGFTSNEVTMSAWIKPDGTQGDYTGIVFNDDVSAGLNLVGNNVLAYHWPGGSWSWNSGLSAPSGEWSHVALVATPTSLTIYVNGESSVHDVNLDEVEFGSMKIGSYKGWNARNFKGKIDEVCVYNRSLNQDEIRELRHLTKVPSDDLSLVSYYQFNRPSGSILDRSGLNHAALTGGAVRSISSAPVGGGTSHRLDMNSAGNYEFPGTGLSVELAASTVPNGEVVATRINLAPDQNPNDSPISRSYWIINNYGTNSNFPQPANIRFEGIGEVSADAQMNPNHFRLFQRTENADGNTWGDYIDVADIAESGTDGNVVFSTGNSITNFGQFIISNASSSVSVDPALNTPKEEEVRVFPNPTDNNGFQIITSFSDAATVTIFSMNGKKIKEIQIQKEGFIPTNDLVAGAYIYRVKSAKRMINGVLIVK
jgi:photosystem II stability/assembly factor-like uncharacterized protein/PKD repeat protein